MSYHSSDPLSEYNDFIEKDDFEARQTELQERKDLFHSDLTDEEIEYEEGTEAHDAGPLSDAELEELEEINILLDSTQYADGPYIHEKYFPEYAEQLAQDVVYMPDNDFSSWPFNRIDWEAAARDLEIDYTDVAWRGQVFLVR